MSKREADSDGPKAKQHSIQQLVKDWLEIDRNEETVKQITTLRDAGAWPKLHELLDNRMTFGTAGLRAAMEAGFSRMNDVTVIQASQGLCKYIMQTLGRSDYSVVVSFDARHNSRRFAMRTAAAFISQGATVYLFSDITPTPFVPYAVTKYGCAAGVMVTASHNPKEDNGYKVYWSNGAQIIGPHDVEIQKQIELNSIPWEASWQDITKHKNVIDPLAEVTQSYFADVKKNIHTKGLVEASKLKFTYTAMHGVGHKFAQKSFAAFGLRPFISVKEQCDPDPEFPTVKYPNPEEGKGALALAMKTADENGSTIIVANDPDADRLAVAVKHSGSWRILTGNEIGSILGWWMWFSYRSENPTADPANVYMIASTVSTKMLASMGKVEGFKFEETLTGFKWMGNKARDLMAEGRTVLFSFEEAIGFCCGTNVVDKDGISACAVVADMAMYLETKGLDIVDQLDAIYNAYGYHVTNNSYFICHSQPTIESIFGKIRKDAKYPTKIAGVDVVSVRDLTTGYDNSKPNNVAVMPVQSGNMITFTLANETVMTLRTSGTEPKIKYYTERRGECKTMESRQKLADELQATVDLMVEELLEPKANSLIARSS